MKQTFSVPRMWADHHVLKVREALLALAGVQDVYASAAWKQVIVTYDDKAIDKAALSKSLAQAGYPVGEADDLLGRPLYHGDKSWHELGARMTETNQKDLEMSGEFRRY